MFQQTAEQPEFSGAATTVHGTDEENVVEPFTFALDLHACGPTPVTPEQLRRFG